MAKARTATKVRTEGPHMETVRALFTTFQARALGVGYTGHKRDEALLEFFCGAVAVMERQDHEHLAGVQKFLFFVVSIHGFKGAADFLKAEDA